MFFFFARSDDKAWGGGKRFDITLSKNDTEYKEYIIDLTANEHWKGTVIGFRVDPVNTVSTGEMYIDSIEFLKELPE
jgi:hypothetical protein